MAFVIKDKITGKYLGCVDSRYCVVDTLEQAVELKKEDACSQQRVSSMSGTQRI